MTEIDMNHMRATDLALTEFLEERRKKREKIDNLPDLRTVYFYLPFQQ